MEYVTKINIFPTRYTGKSTQNWKKKYYSLTLSSFNSTSPAKLVSRCHCRRSFRWYGRQPWDGQGRPFYHVLLFSVDRYLPSPVRSFVVCCSSCIELYTSQVLGGNALFSIERANWFDIYRYQKRIKSGLWFKYLFVPFFPPLICRHARLSDEIDEYLCSCLDQPTGNWGGTGHHQPGRRRFDESERKFPVRTCNPTSL